MARASGRDYSFERLAPGVHAARAITGGAGLCNSAIVDLGGTTVVFDTGTSPAGGRTLYRAAIRLTGRPPAFVVNSHYHADHHWGNAAFPGAHLVATRRTRALVLARSARTFREWRKVLPQEIAALGHPTPPIESRDVPELRGWFRAVLRIPAPLRVVPPDLTFSGAIRLEGTRRAVDVISYGGGHTDSDAFAFLPDERIVCAGDLALSGYHLSMGDGWPVPWIEILRRIERLRPTAVVPGHGAVGGGELLRQSAEYAATIVALARRARRAGRAVGELRRTEVPERYRALRFSLMFPENLVRAYRLSGRRAPRPPEFGSFK